MIKELQYKGYATEPSDYECPDGQLATSLNLINEDNQLKPVFQPALIAELPEGEYRVMLMHHTATDKHYIVILQNNNTFNIYYRKTSSQTLNHIGTINGTCKNITAIGNTLVVLSTTTMEYIMWNTDSQQYVKLGQKPPQINIAFSLDSEFVAYPGWKNNGTETEKPLVLKNTIDLNDIPLPTYASTNSWVPPRPVAAIDNPDFTDFDFSLENMTGENGDGSVNTEVAKITQWALAAINKTIAKEGKDKERFIFPFFVRYAYKCYDGTYFMHSYPTLLIPNSRGPFLALNSSTGFTPEEDHDRGFELDKQDGAGARYTFRGRVYTFASELRYTIANDIRQDMQKWKDIIRSIDIFVTPPIYTYDQQGKVYGWKNMDNNTTPGINQDAWRSFYTIARLKYYEHDGVTKWNMADIFPELSRNADTQSNEHLFYRYSDEYTMPSYIMATPEHTEKEIHDSMTNESRFYKIYSFDIDEIINDNDFAQRKTLPIEKGTLASLESRETLNDDYHSRDSITAETAYTYNSRLNIANIERTMHSPIPPTTQWTPWNKDTSGNTRTYKIAVKVKKNGVTRVITSASEQVNCDYPQFIYYPDRYACEAYIHDGTYTRKVKLKEHTTLYGAYWCAPLWQQPQMETVSEFPQTHNPPIGEEAKIYTSEVNNPFVFTVKGINTVGTGTILGISSAAKAMSQGQFGQFPLYAFTTEGVWALEVSSTGAYSAQHPITRDVCINTDSITQIDSSVLFATDRGIMLISGSQTQCITDNIFSEAPFNVLDLPGIDQLHAKLGHSADACLPMQPFLGFLAGCQMVYDYVHQRIFVYNPTKVNGSPKYTYAYVFSLKSKMWGMVFTNLASTINAYPEALAMTLDNKLVSFSETDEEVCKGLYITRPLKLEAADVHKTISALIQRGHFQRGDVGTVLYGSRDLYTWHLIWSSKDHYLRGFRGTPYKYFRIAGLATLTDGKSIFGASVNFEPRHTNQLR